MAALDKKHPGNQIAKTCWANHDNVTFGIRLTPSKCWVLFCRDVEDAVPCKRLFLT